MHLMMYWSIMYFCEVVLKPGYKLCIGKCPQTQIHSKKSGRKLISKFLSQGKPDTCFNFKILTVLVMFR